MTDQQRRPLYEDGHGPRHLRVDDRPPVRDLDESQLAAEALAALQAETARAPETEPPALIPFDSRPAAVGNGPESTAQAGAGRHRRPVSTAGSGVPAPAAALLPPPASPFRTGRAGSKTNSSPPGGSIPARSRLGRLPWPAVGRVAAAVIALAALVTLVLLGLGDVEDPPAGGPTPTTGTEPSGSQGPGTAASVSDPEIAVPTSTLPATSPPSAGTSGTDGQPAPSADSRQEDPDAISEGEGRADVPAPAVLSTLAPDDDGFGWPSTAFGRPSIR